MRVKNLIIIMVTILIFFNYVIPFTVFAEDNKLSEEIFFDDFSGDTLDKSKWLVADKAWGGGNGGVVPENVSISDGILRLEGHGDNYTGNVPGVNREDGTRTGAAIATRDYFGSGSYEVVAKVAPELGVCSAIWTFEYEEYYKGDKEYEDHGATGSYYAVNHEIDIEMPGRPYSKHEDISYEYALCNTWVGEKGNEYTASHTKLPSPQNDGKFHKYRFDWHTGDKNEEPRVEFYFDDQLVVTNKTHIPTNEGRLWIGLWFPNGWAGKDANFDKTVFEIDYVKIIPFHEAGDTKQSETYAKDGWDVDSFPEDIESENYNHIINGDFSEGEKAWNLNGDAYIDEGIGKLSSGSKTDTLYQVVSIKPKMTYTITADVETDGTEVNIGIKKANGEENQSVTIDKSGKVVFTFVTPKSIKEMKVYIEVLRYQENNNQVKIDNVTLYSGHPKEEEPNSLKFNLDLNMDKTQLHQGDYLIATMRINQLQLNRSNGIITLSGNLDFDKKLFELENIEGLGTWNCSYEDFNEENLKFVTESNEYIKETGDLLKFTFRVKEDASFGESYIKIENICAGTGQMENGLIFANNISKSIKIISKPTLIGDIDLDGEITINDLAILKLHLIEKKLIDNEKIILADIDLDNEITINDLAKMKLILIEK